MMFRKKPDQEPAAGPRGWAVPGGGASVWLQAPPEIRGSSVQICGLWPFSAGAAAPVVGVPLGWHLGNRSPVCCDPISWFQRAKLLQNPSVFVLGLPGLGKSTLVRRMLIGLAAQGVNPLVLGDLKPDYVAVVRALGGQVIELGNGAGSLNVLDPGESRSAAAKLRVHGCFEQADRLDHEARSRRLALVKGLVSAARGEPVSGKEDLILSRAIELLDAKANDVVLLRDLIDLIEIEAPDELRLAAFDRNERQRYLDATEDLVAALTNLDTSARFGGMFSRPTSEPLQRDRPAVFDVHRLSETDKSLQATALLSCWAAGFVSIDVAHALADAGLGPSLQFFIVLDELWRALRAGSGIVELVDVLTRLNRTFGVGTAMLTHTMKDLLSLPSEEDRAMALGFVERAGMVISGGLPEEEMPKLTKAIRLSDSEQQLLQSWRNPPSWDSRTASEKTPPGLGKFLIKVGGRSGIPCQVELTRIELDHQVHDTNQRWYDAAVAR